MGMRQRVHHIISRISQSPKTSVITIYVYSPQVGGHLDDAGGVNKVSRGKSGVKLDLPHQENSVVLV
jgi:hypothetical protein